MPRALVVNADISIPAAELVFTFARSAGPGGQNVNKVNTKAVLRWRVVDTPSLPAVVRTRFLAKYGNRVNGDGELVLACDEHREQGRNLTRCREKLRTMIATVLTPPRRRIKTRPSRGAERRALSDGRLGDRSSGALRRPARLDVNALGGRCGEQRLAGLERREVVDMSLA